MTYPEYILKNFMMTDAEITSRILSDCRRVYLVIDKPMEALFTWFWNIAVLAPVIAIVQDCRRMN